MGLEETVDDEILALRRQSSKLWSRLHNLPERFYTEFVPVTIELKQAIRNFLANNGEKVAATELKRSVTTLRGYCNGSSLSLPRQNYL